MRRVEVAFYMLPPGPGRRDPYRSRFKMTAEEAKARGAVRIVPNTVEPRDVPETHEERLRAQMHYQSAGFDAVKPPRS